MQVSRLIKRRELAKQACAQAKVILNGREAKGGVQVKLGDRIDLSLGGRILVVQVVEIRERAKADEARNLYRVLEDGRLDESPG